VDLISAWQDLISSFRSFRFASFLALISTSMYFVRFHSCLVCLSIGLHLGLVGVYSC
jgi:hypothetical protein